MLEVDFLSTLLLLFKERKWREILHLNENSNSEIARNISWVWPSEKNLNFIQQALKKFNLKGVISIGCGCGLFEWLLQQSSGKYNTTIIIV